MKERKNNIEFITKTSNKFIKILQSIDKNDDNFYSFDVNCKKLIDYNNNDIRQSNEFKTIFSKLTSIKGPVLYWIEILNNVDNINIRKAMIDYSKSPNSKTVPAIKKSFDNKSKILYVGKVKKIYWGRIIQHLGYYKNKRTQGLQLYYWAKQIGLNIRFNSFEFQPEMDNLVSIFEIELAKNLKPIIGKHK